MSAMTIRMLALAALLGLLLWATHPPSSTPTRVSDLNPAEIQHIRLTRAGRTIVALERRAEGWRLTAPLQGMAQEATVQQLLQLLSARSFRQLPAPENPADFGLQPPLAVFRFDDTELAFGAIEPVNHKRYLLSNGRLHLIHDRFARLALHSRAEDFLQATTEH